jgi:hypothetical protein
MGVVENLKDVADLVKKAGEIELYKKISAAEDEVRELTREKRRLEDRVEELERALKLKNTMKFKAPLYYQEGDEVPFCPACYEKDGRAVHVVKNDDAEWYCTSARPSTTVVLHLLSRNDSRVSSRRRQLVFDASLRLPLLSKEADRVSV